MNAVIYHGGRPGDAGVEALHAQLTALLQARGWAVETLRLAELSIKPCRGCFACWLKTPGACAIADDGRTAARAFVQHDLVIFLTPVTFGGYASPLKLALDRIIPAASPFFMRVNGEMHHKRRYPKPPRICAVGWLPQADEAAAEVFRRLLARNAINFHAPVSASLVLHAEQDADGQQAQLAQLVATLGGAR